MQRSAPIVVSFRRQWLPTIAAGVLLLAAGACRWVACLDDFWLDEIWSWWYALQASSAWQILTEIHDSNNHVLNTWLIYTLGTDQPWIVYRIPAALAGTLTVALAGWRAARRDTVESLTAMALTGASYLMIQFSSEARGYAYVVFFSMAAFVLMERWLAAPAPSRWLDLLFAVTCVLGFLSHTSFVFCYGALLAWSLGIAVRKPRPWRSLRRLAELHAVPLVFFAWFYYVSIAPMRIGGGPDSSVGEAVVQALSLAVGGREDGGGMKLVAAVTASAFVAAIVLLWRTGSNLWMFHALAVVIVPAVVIAAAQPELFYVRFLLVSVLFVQLSIAALLSQLFRQGVWGRAGYALVLTAILGGNSWHTAELLRTGRGSYAAALALMVAETKGPTVTIGSDHDFRNGMLLEFYSRRLNGPRRLVYYPQGRWPPEGPEWLVTHSLERIFIPPASLTDGNGNQYRLVRVFPYAGLSGWHWAVYRNANTPS